MVIRKTLWHGKIVLVAIIEILRPFAVPTKVFDADLDFNTNQGPIDTHGSHI